MIATYANAVRPSVARPTPAAAPSVEVAHELERRVAEMQQQLDAARTEADHGRAAARKVEQELQLASRLQRDFLPKRMPNHGQVQFNQLYRPAGHVSGDLYDVRRLDEHYAGVYLLDAMGHGMPAALLAMFMHNALKTKTIDPDGCYRVLTPAESMADLNDTLLAQRLSGQFATAVYATVDCAGGKVEFARAGHPMPMLLRGQGQNTRIEELGGEGALLGVMADERYEPCRVQLEPGDRMLFFTDGVESAFPDADGCPSMDQWRHAVADRKHLSADALVADLSLLLSDRRCDDDFTLVTVEMS